MVVFESKREKFSDEVTIKCSDKRVHPTISITYLGVNVKAFQLN